MYRYRFVRACLWGLALWVVGCGAPPADPCAGVSCKDGEVCSQGTCGATCSQGKQLCGSECRDLQSDGSHCGACDKACGSGEVCQAGACTQKECPQGSVRCGEGCVDPQTHGSHCGGCDKACGDGQKCRGGACKSSCTSGLSSCGTRCVDLQSDTGHCGACDAACASGEVCNAGSCAKECSSGKQSCGGGCVDTHSDAAHCGGCGKACDSSETCKAGACVPTCPKGETPCGQTCIDLQKASKHCGACGTVCGAGQRCLLGKCSKGWALSAGGSTTQSNERSFAMLIDPASGDIYVAGSFQKQIAFDKHRLTSASDRGLFVVKLDAQQKVLWAQAASAHLSDRLALALDPKGALYVGGTFHQASARFGSIELKNPPYGSGPHKQYTSRMFVARMQASDGAWSWATVGGANAQTTTDGLGVNSQGQVYVTGTFVTQAEYPKASFGSTDLVGQGGSEIVVASLDKDGRWLWARREGSASNDYARGLAIDADDNVYLIGYFLKAISFGSTTLTPQGGYDGFVAKMDKSHKWLWAKAFTGSDSTQDLAVDAKGNAYVIGGFSSAVSMPGCSRLTRVGASDIFAAKLSPAGACMWLVGGGGRGSDVGVGIAADSSGNAYILGRFYTSATAGDQARFGPFKLQATPGVNDWHIVAAKINAKGTYEWAVSGGGKDNEYPEDIALSPRGQVYITGHFRGAVAFGSHALKSSGGEDIFFASLDAKGSFQAAASQGGSAGGYESIAGVAQDNDGNTYFIGRYSGALTLGSEKLQSPDTGHFVASVAADGSWRWVEEIRPTDPNGSGIELKGIAVDAAGHVAITGAASSSSFGSLAYKARGTQEDLFVAKLDKDGKWLWVTGGGGGKDEDASGLAVAFDAKGDIYVAGESHAGSIGGISFTSSGRIAVAKLDKDGKWLWIAGAGNNRSDRASAIAVDAQNRAYIAGRIQGNKGSLTFGALSIPTTRQGRLAFAARLDKDGKWQWVALGDSESNAEASGIAVGQDGTSYVSGWYDRSQNFGPHSLKSAGNQDGFVAALDKDGKWKWAQSFGNAQADRLNGIALSSDGALLVTGIFQAELSLGAAKLDSGGARYGTYAMALDTTGKVLWAKQPLNQTPLAPNEASFEARALAPGPDGSAILAGYYNGSAAFGDTTLSSTGASDLFLWLVLP